MDFRSAHSAHTSWVGRASFHACLFAPSSYRLGQLSAASLHSVCRKKSTQRRSVSSQEGRRHGDEHSIRCASPQEHSCCQQSSAGDALAIWRGVCTAGLTLLMAASPVLAAMQPAAHDPAALTSHHHAPFRIALEEATSEEASVSQGVLEDRLTETLRQVEAKVDSALALVSRSFPGFGGRNREEADTASQEGRELIKEVWEVVAQKYVDARGPGFDQQRWSELRDAALSKPLHDKAATYRAIREMLAEGLSDPYTRFITGDQFAAMQSYDITGVGLNLCTAAELEEKTDLHPSQPGLYVLGLINKSAASRAGFEQGDQILEVDGMPIREQSPFQTAALIQGPEDAPATPAVTLKVRRPSGQEREVRLQRPAKDPSPVSAWLAENGGRKVGNIRLEKFVSRTQQDVAAAVQSLASQGAQEYVLDLRNNLGGLVEEGVEVARLFLDGDATVVNRLDASGLRRKTAAGGTALTRAPVTLLVNEHTASASEILAGALRDNCRALLVGQRTFGKGLIQGVFQLEDGSALAVTIGKYLTPARTDIDREGLRPDFGSIPEPHVAAARLAACKAPDVYAS